MKASAGTRNPIALGLALGEPTGFTGVVELSESTDVDFGVGASYYRSVTVWADHLWKKKKIFAGDDHKAQEFFQELTGYFGPGVFLDNLGPGFIRLGLRFAFGLQYPIPKSDFRAYLELAPALAFAATPAFGFQASLGGRYYF